MRAGAEPSFRNIKCNFTDISGTLKNHFRESANMTYCVTTWKENRGKEGEFPKGKVNSHIIGNSDN